MKKVIILVIGLLLLTGCSNKYYGTWCLYAEIPSSLLILNEDVTNEDINIINQYLDSLNDVRSHDLVDNIEEANKMINVYYLNKNNIETYENRLKTYRGIKKIEFKILNQAKESLIINKKDYTYGINLNTEYSTETSGNPSFNDDVITLNHNLTFYYKDKFLCKDEDCNIIFTKSKTKTCN